MFDLCRRGVLFQMERWVSLFHRETHVHKIETVHNISSLVIKVLCYKLEGHGFDTRQGDFLNLPNPSGRSRPWCLLCNKNESQKQNNNVSGAFYLNWFKCV
jgi:hypothetical protein